MENSDPTKKKKKKIIIKKKIIKKKTSSNMSFREDGESSTYKSENTGNNTYMDMEGDEETNQNGI